MKRKCRVYFPEEPNLRPNANGHKWQLITDFTLFIDGVKVVIPAGFWTDFASIPKFISTLSFGYLSVLDDHLKAAILHDWLYFCGMLFGRPISRYKADILFYEGMYSCGTSYIKRNSMYAGVRAGGWKPYNNYRREQKIRESKNETEKI